MTDQTKLSRRSLAAGISGASLAGMALMACSGPQKAMAGTPPSARPKRIPADDRLDLIELMARYAWAYDTANEAGLAATFTPDGVIEVFGKPLVTDHAGFGPFLAMAADMRGDKGWQHLTDHHVFEDYDGKSCKVFSYYLMPESDPKGGEVYLRAMGYYVSYCVRGTDGAWLFARREVFRWTGKQPF